MPADAPTPRRSTLRSAILPLQILAAIAVVVMLYVGRAVLLPIVLAVFLFYALDPIVDRLEKWRVPRGLAAIAVVLMTLVGVTGGALALWPQLETVVTRVPEGATKLRTALRAARGASKEPSALQKVQAAADAIDRAAAESAAPPVTSRGTVLVEVAEPWRVSDALWVGGLGIVGLFGQFVSVLFLTTFLLIEDDSFKRKLVRRIETLGGKKVTVEILNDIARQMERFIWVQAVTSAGVAVVTALGLWGLGVQQPAVWGIFAGVMNLVPFFGPFIVTIVIGAVAFLQFGTLGYAALVGAMTLAVTSAEGNFITPQLLSRVASINLVVLFVAIAFWSAVWGVAGMLLAAPMLMALKVVCDHIEGLEGVADFLSA
ncbi:MAG: AI-2E family transporter [Acidobacteria bacterium]|nr:AI-2E family transporter [Acidobacteriota bacterium]